MATFPELLKKYMGDTPIQQGRGNCNVQSLVDGPAYFSDVTAAIQSLSLDPIKHPFIYMTGWFFATGFDPDGPGGVTSLSQLLRDKAASGVDVRVLGWVFPPDLARLLNIIASGAGGPLLGSLPAGTDQLAGLNDVLGITIATIRFINELRTEPKLQNTAALNILAHPGGATHLKIVIVGNDDQAVAYTGGIDFEAARQNPAVWRDAQAKLTGPVVQDVFDTFRVIWNENGSRPPATGLLLGTPPNQVTYDANTASMPILKPRVIRSSTPGLCHVRSVRTFPTFAPVNAGLLRLFLPDVRPLSFAPNGLFEVREAWRQALSQADQFIYIEDQGLTSSEVMDWANAALKQSATVKVVLLGSGRDPTAASPPDQDLAMNRAVQSHLMNGLTAAQAGRVKFLTPTSGIIHAKTSVVDDNWAILGSANCMRRSLFTDFEHAAAFMDEANLAVAAHRRKLWGRFFSAAQLAVPRANPIDIWFDSAVPTPSQLSVRAPAGFPVPDPASDVKLNLFLEVDSRRDWPQFSLPAPLIDARQWPVVEKPNAGTIVKTLQTLLVKAGLSVGASGIDGKFGNDTVSAVKSFRATRGLPIGESVDADVWPVLVTPLRRGANRPLSALCNSISSTEASR